MGRRGAERREKKQKRRRIGDEERREGGGRLGDFKSISNTKLTKAEFMRVRPHGLSVILSSHLYIMIMQASLPLAPLHSPLLLTNSATASLLLLQGAPCSPQFLLYVRNFLSLVDPFLHFLRPPLLSEDPAIHQLMND